MPPQALWRRGLKERNDTAQAYGPSLYTLVLRSRSVLAGQAHYQRERFRSGGIADTGAAGDLAMYPV
jgi:hypothetical protein